MDRRRVIKISCLGTSSFLAGCSANGAQEGDEDSYPSEVIDWDFETNIRTEASVGDDPIIFFQRHKNTVIVEGVGWYGSSHCGYLNAVSPEYDEETSALSVEVVAERDEDSAGEARCGDDAAADSYRVTVRFDGGVPSRIDAEHPWDHKTIEFSEPGAIPADISEN